MKLPSSFFSIRFVIVHVVHQYSSIDTTAAWKKTAFYFNGQVWLSSFENKKILILEAWKSVLNAHHGNVEIFCEYTFNLHIFMDLHFV